MTRQTAREEISTQDVDRGVCKLDGCNVVHKRGSTIGNKHAADVAFMAQNEPVDTGACVECGVVHGHDETCSRVVEPDASTDVVEENAFPAPAGEETDAEYVARVERDHSDYFAQSDVIVASMPPAPERDAFADVEESTEAADALAQGGASGLEQLDARRADAPGVDGSSHTFEPSWSGRTCARMVLRDGFGVDCGKSAEDVVHARRAALTAPEVPAEPEYPTALTPELRPGMLVRIPRAVLPENRVWREVVEVERLGLRDRVTFTKGEAYPAFRNTRWEVAEMPDSAAGQGATEAEAATLERCAEELVIVLGPDSHLVRHWRRRAGELRAGRAS